MNNMGKALSEKRIAGIDRVVSKCRQENSDLPEDKIIEMAAEKLIRGKCVWILLPDIAINALGAVPVVNFVIYDTAGIIANFWYINNAQKDLTAELEYLYGKENVIIESNDKSVGAAIGIFSVKELIWQICAKIAKRAGIVSEEIAVRGVRSGVRNAGKWFLRKEVLTFLPVLGAAAGACVDINFVWKHGKNVAAKLTDNIRRQ
jgi:hypothetical protein